MQFGRLDIFRFDGALNVDVIDPRTCIHLGQEGIQVSNACWALFGLEHDIQPRGGIMTFVSTAPVDELGGAARWTAVELDGQLTLISVHMPHKGRKLGEFEAALMEIQEIVNGRPKQHVILGGDFNVSLYGMTDCLHVGESIPRPRTLVDTNDSLRARVLHTVVTELDLTVTNTWMDADSERELFTRSSWSNPEDSLTQMDFIMTSRKLDMEQVQVLISDWFKTDHRAVFAVLSLEQRMRYTMRNGANLRGWEPDDSWHDTATATQTDWKSWNKLAPLLVETAKAHRKLETKEMSVAELELKTLLLRKKKNRTEPRAVRTELALSSNLEKEKSVETREALGQNQGECRDGESLQENAVQAFQLEINCKRRKSRICSHKILPRPLLNPRRPGGVNQSERRHWVEVWKNMRMDYAGGMLISHQRNWKTS